MKEDYSIPDDSAAYQEDGEIIMADGGDPSAEDFDGSNFYEVPGADVVDGKVVVSDENVKYLAESLADSVRDSDPKGGLRINFHNDEFDDAVSGSIVYEETDFDSKASVAAEIGLAIAGVKYGELGSDTPGSPDYGAMVDEAITGSVTVYSEDTPHEELVAIGTESAENFKQVFESEQSDFEEGDFTFDQRSDNSGNSESGDSNDKGFLRGFLG